MSMKVIVKRITEPHSKRQTWQIIGHDGELPDNLQIGVNGGYAGIYSATAQYQGDTRLEFAKARVLRTWTDRIDDTYEQTRFAEVEILL